MLFRSEFTVTKDQKPLVYSVSAKCTADGLNISWQSTDNADVKAKYENGVLIVSLAKKTPAAIEQKSRIAIEG